MESRPILFSSSTGDQHGHKNHSDHVLGTVEMVIHGGPPAQPAPAPTRKLTDKEIIEIAEMSGIPPGYRASMILGHTNVAWVFAISRGIEAAIEGKKS